MTPPRPASLRLGNGPRAVLVIHGFTGAPPEIEPIATRLAADGFRVRAPLLPGHGTNIDDLNTTTEGDWERAARRELDDLYERTGAPVSLVGFSMGGLLALLLAADAPERVRSVAVLATPFHFPSVWTRVALGVLRITGLARLIGTLPKGSSGLPSDVQAKRFVYESWPLPALNAFRRLMRRTRRSLHRVQAPVLALYGGLDTVAPAGNIELLFDSIASRVKDSEIFESSAHVLALDRDAEHVVERVARFTNSPT